MLDGKEHRVRPFHLAHNDKTATTVPRRKPPVAHVPLKYADRF